MALFSRRQAARRSDAERDRSTGRKITRRKFLGGLIGAAVVGTPLGVYGHAVEGNDLEVVRIHVPLAQWPVGVAELKIGFLSDLHCDSDDAVQRSERAARMLAAEQPDIILLGGDYISHSTARFIGPMAQALVPLAAAPFGIFAVFGNHDWWSGKTAEIGRALQGVGVAVLENQSVPVRGREGVWIVGMGDCTVKRESASAALRGVPDKGAAKILLVHEPDYADDAPTGFAFQVSGHSHAGQVRILGRPMIVPPLGRRYPQGLQQAKNHLVYTSRGVGMVTPQIRLACPPEVSVITVGPSA